MATYEAVISYWDGACYETCEHQVLDSETLEDAIAEVQAMTWDNAKNSDIKVEIEDEDGAIVNTEKFPHSVAKSQQEKRAHAPGRSIAFDPARVPR